jgi:hypothetical protein
MRMAEENRSLGFPAIPGSAVPSGHEVGRGAMAEMLARHGMEPAPERGRKMEGVPDAMGLIGAAGFFTGPRGRCSRTRRNPADHVMTAIYFSERIGRRHCRGHSRLCLQAGLCAR